MGTTKDSNPVPPQAPPIRVVKDSSGGKGKNSK